MILANWLRRVSEEPHSSTAPSRLVEALLLPWSVSMSSDVPYWRPPTPRSVWSFSWRPMVSKPVCGPRGAQVRDGDYTSKWIRELYKVRVGLSTDLHLNANNTRSS